jgi:AraC-like DNA-binding protein
MSVRTDGRIAFRANDPDQFAEAISKVVRRVSVRPRGLEFKSEGEARKLSRLAMSSFRFTPARFGNPDPCPWYSVHVPLTSPVVDRARSRPEACDPGAARIRNWDERLDLTFEQDGSLLLLRVDKSLVESYTKKLNGGVDAGDVRFPNSLSFETPAGGAFRRCLRFLWDESTRDGSLFQSPLVVREMEDSLLATLLFATGKDGTVLPGESCPRKHVARAEDYILAHLEDPISIADVAEAAGVSARTLFREFRKRHGVGPKAFLKARRLEAAQRALLAADPRERSVTDIALDYGFGHFGRFSVEYKRAFQESPSDTLRR